MIFLGGRVNHDGNQDAAEALWRQAIETGDPETSAHAAFTLGELLEGKAKPTRPKRCGGTRSKPAARTGQVARSSTW
jgi:hypothetical protein